MNITVPALYKILQTHPNDKIFVLLRKNLDRHSLNDEFNIDFGLDVYGATQSATLLTYCINNDYLDAAELLLKNGANPNLGQVRAIHCAAMRNNPDAIDLLEYYGSNLDATDPDGHTAIYLSICHGKIEARKCLMSKEIDVNKSPFGTPTPMIHAVVQGDLTLVKALIKKGANLSGTEDDTLVAIAEYEGHNDIAAYLLTQELAGDVFTPY